MRVTIHDVELAPPDDWGLSSFSLAGPVREIAGGRAARAVAVVGWDVLRQEQTLGQFVAQTVKTMRDSGGLATSGPPKARAAKVPGASAAARLDVRVHGPQDTTLEQSIVMAQVERRVVVLTVSCPAELAADLDVEPLLESLALNP